MVEGAVMAREFINGAGGDNDDFRLHLVATSAQSAPGVTFPTQTADAVGAPDGDRWIAMDNTAGDYLLGGATAAITPKTYTWACCNAVRVRGTLGVGENDRIVGFSASGALQLEWVRVSNTTFNFRLTRDAGRTLIATGSTPYTVDTSYSWRIQCDGSMIKLCVNGSPEISAAFVERFDSQVIKLYAPNAATQIHYFSRIVLCQSASISDRPNEDAEMQMLEADGDYEQGWGDDADCNPGETTATATDVDLDVNDQVETTNYWCENATEGDSNTAEMEDPAAFTGTILGTQWRAVLRANVIGKAGDFNARMHNGTDSSEQAGTGLGDDTWRGQCRVFPDPLTGGNTWEDEIDDLKAGATGDDGNGANPQLAGLIVNVFAVGDDPPGVEEGVEALSSAAFGSANPMVF